jgi:hypothetical protein
MLNVTRSILFIRVDEESTWIYTRTMCLLGTFGAATAADLSEVIRFRHLVLRCNFFNLNI